ncbi:MAG: sialidase family protein [Anaerolineae bacterium]
MLQHVTIVRDDSLYQSFPDVALATDGHLVLVYREADAHVATESRLALLDSHDCGQTWVGKRYLDVPMSLRRNGAVWNCPRIVRQRDGGLTILCDLAVSPPGTIMPVPEERQRFRTYIWRSFDQGRTWSARRSTCIQGYVPDRLFELTDDTWLVASHYHSLRHFDTLTQIVNITYDAGENWTNTSLVAEVAGLRFCEGSLARCANGFLVCYLRENSMRNIPTHKSFSSDGGLHWSLPEPCRFIGHRPVAGLLGTGRMLVTYRDVRLLDPSAELPVGANTATMAWLGDPYDEASGHVLTLEVDEAGVFGDYGYSGWVQLSDGRVFCAYHHRGDAPKSYLRGVWFHEEDVVEEPPLKGGEVYY